MIQTHHSTTNCQMELGHAFRHGECFICYESSPHPIHAGCGCRSDNGMVHVECMATKACFQDEQRGKSVWKTCQTCKQSFSGEMAMRLAIEWVSHALRASDVAIDDADPNLFRAQRHLARCHLAFGNAADAVDLNRARLRLFLGNNDRYTIVCAGDLAFSLACTGQFAEASELFGRVKDAIPIVFGAEHRTTIQFRRNYAIFLLKRGMCAESEQMFREILWVLVKQRKTNGSSARECMSNLAISLARQGQYDEARTLNVQLLLLETRALGSEHVRTKQTSQRLKDLV